jgi:hypothetical protein
MWHRERERERGSALDDLAGPRAGEVLTRGIRTATTSSSSPGSALPSRTPVARNASERRLRWALAGDPNCHAGRRRSRS